MFEFGGEELMEIGMGRYRIQLLLWIQLLVILLLLLLLFSFSVSPSDLTAVDASASASAPPLFTSNNPSRLPQAPLLTTNPTTASRNPKMGETSSMNKSRSRSRRRMGREEIQEGEREDSSTTPSEDAMAMTVFEHSHHPCNYLKLATQVFLKCLGLDSSSEDS
ncbi:uncharacterized protein LOC131159563 [Malania oleifera]|uniref:uncharacterized protein LOC131159563 n=1 Tax=Malania oleifera TaxID=397392 RepID=UPI0025AE27E7|nr:uncharacterized protein LOC131159563 [Malania oleifera]